MRVQQPGSIHFSVINRLLVDTFWTNSSFSPKPIIVTRSRQQQVALKSIRNACCTSALVVQEWTTSITLTVLFLIESRTRLFPEQRACSLFQLTYSRVCYAFPHFKTLLSRYFSCVVCTYWSFMSVRLCVWSRMHLHSSIHVRENLRSDKTLPWDPICVMESSVKSFELQGGLWMESKWTQSMFMQYIGVWLEGLRNIAKSIHDSSADRVWYLCANCQQRTLKHVTE
jgi:hypothetical protein